MNLLEINCIHNLRFFIQQVANATKVSVRALCHCYSADNFYNLPLVFDIFQKDPLFNFINNWMETTKYFCIFVDDFMKKYSSNFEMLSAQFRHLSSEDYDIIRSIAS